MKPRKSTCSDVSNTFTGGHSRRRLLQYAGAGGAATLFSTRPNGASAQSPTGTVHFFMTAGAPEEPAWRAMVDAYNAKDTGIQIEFELMLASWEEMYRKLRGYGAAGTSPDIVRHFAVGLKTWADSGEITDLTPFIERDGFALEPFYEAAIEGMTLNDKIWGMPPGIYSEAWFYNKELFQQAGIEAPTDWNNPWTWDQLREVALAMTSGDGPNKQYGMSVSMSQYWVLPWLWSNGGDFINAEGTECVINQPAAVEALQFQRDLILEDKVSPTPTDIQTIPASQLFYTGKVGILEGGSWEVAYGLKDAAIDWGVMPIAKGKADARTIQLIDFFAIQEASENKDAAWEVLKFFVSPEAEQILIDHGIAGIPARKEVAEQNAETMFERDSALWLQGMEVARSANLIQGYQEAMDILNRHIELVKLDQKSVQDAADEIAEEVNALIAKEREE